MLKKIFILVFYLLSSSFLYAQNTENFLVPEPPGGKLVDTKNFSLDDKHPIETFLYSATLDPEQIAGFYLNYFDKKEFKKTMDNLEAKTKRRVLRFKKDEEVVSIAITPKQNGSEIVLARYRQLPGEPEIEKLKPSLHNPLFALPKQDVPGVDLAQVPRPPESVRMMGKHMGGGALLLYTTILDVGATADFYKTKMPDQGWRLENDIATKDAVDAYKRATKKKTLGISAPFSDGEDFEQIVTNSCVLVFKGSEGEAKITIFSNFMDRKLGSMVQIILRNKNE